MENDIIPSKDLFLVTFKKEVENFTKNKKLKARLVKNKSGFLTFSPIDNEGASKLTTNKDGGFVKNLLIVSENEVVKMQLFGFSKKYGEMCLIK